MNKYLKRILTATIIAWLSLALFTFIVSVSPEKSFLEILAFLLSLAGLVGSVALTIAFVLEWINQKDKETTY